jgi:hypothetical protein
MASFAPGLSFIDTHSKADTTNCKSFTFKIKPDICVYADGALPPHPRQSSCDISAAEVVIEFKWGFHHSPFYIPANGSYIIIWDREGATVFSAINYNEEPHLADFLHCYAQASPALHGVDTLVMPASIEEAHLARLQLDLPATKCMLKVAVPAINNSGLITLIFLAPVPVGQTHIGQCTYACPAYNIDNEKVVMLKDSWWVASTDILPEGKTYRLLKEHNVSNIASCIACHDIHSIPQQALQTYKFADAAWVCMHNTITLHIHYHLVLNIVGK